ncbi:MAG: hypothetical protein EXQ63_05890 [Ilumatobacteraceae bacterium]|nr:hypothetical protein [Ilumatobacteraceae bacterium]
MTPRHARITVVRTLIVAALLSTLVALLDPPTSISADTLPPVAVVVRGHGHGHGRGLSQYGALGWATTYTKTWQEILAFYYGADASTTSVLTPSDAALLPSGAMTVRLQTLDGAQTGVISDNASASWSGTPDVFGSLLARQVGTNIYDVYASSASSCAAVKGEPTGFTLVGDNVVGPIKFVSAKGSLPAAVSPIDLLGLCEPPTKKHTSGRVRYYRGTIQAITDSQKNQRTVNIVDTESYLRGVVPRESSAGWGDLAAGSGMNALRAQAVAARSYAMSEDRYTSVGVYAKTCDTTDCQVYGGSAWRDIGGTTKVIEDVRTDRAVADTANTIIRSTSGSVVRTEFSSSNGGRTISNGTTDDGDLAANAVLQNWSATLLATDIQKKYPSIGIFTSITTTHDGLGGDFGGYATSVAITGTAATVTRVPGQFRSDFGLNSSWFDTIAKFGADSLAAPVGSMLVIGDSVTESIVDEFSSLITPAYPNTIIQACTGRGMIGSACLFPQTTPSLNLDGVSVLNALETPAIALIALGYNDNSLTYDSELAQMIAALTTKGVQRMIFVNMSARYTTRNYSLANASLSAAATANPNITILDWNTASADASSTRWFDNSSVCCFAHLTRTGQTEFALFVRTQLDNLRAQGMLPTTTAPVAVLPGLPLGELDRGSMVKTLQKTLNVALELAKNKQLLPDGMYGAKTSRAVKKFQRIKGLTVSGSVDRATWEALGLAEKPWLAALKVGSQHSAVKTIQDALAKVLKKKIVATGIYSAVTQSDVKLFQTSVGLKPTGNVSGNTWMVLMPTAALVQTG